MENMEIGLKKKTKNKKAYITRLLKAQGKYSPELSQQVQLAARLLVRMDALEAAMSAEDYRPVVEERSREGNSRVKLNPMEYLYLEYVKKTQEALKALGMNIDAKERKGMGGDTFSDFMQEFKEESE